MFKSILGKITGSDECESCDETVLKVQKMNLLEMRAYVNNKVVNLEVDEIGLNEVIKKLLKLNDDTSKRYIEMIDMDTKKKKGFELILLILKSKKTTVATIELAQKFIQHYSDIIEKYDTENKQIYISKIRDAIKNAAAKINMQAKLERKMRTLS